MADIQLNSQGVSSVNPSLFPTGSALAPSIAFASATTTGLFATGAGLVFVASTSVLMAMFTGAGGLVRMTNSVGFGWASGSADSTGIDLTLTRQASGSMGIGGLGNGAVTGISQLAENVIIAAAATSTSVIQLPANAILLGVTSRVTTIGSAGWPATYSVAVGATTVASGISTALNTTDPGTVGCPIQKPTATAITITPIGTPGDALGRIRCTLHFLQLTPATS